MTNDGADEIAIGRSLPWDSGADLLIYDIVNNELIKTISIESVDSDLSLGDRRWQPAIIVDPVSDFTDDGIGEIAVVMSVGMSSQKQLKLIVIDYINSEIVSDFLAKGTNVDGIGDIIATYGSGGELYLLNPEKQLSIISPDDGITSSSPITVTWEDENKESVKFIQVDNQNIMKVTGENAVVDLKEGKRKVSVYSFDKYGKGEYATADVLIEKSSATQLPLSLVFIGLVVLMFSPTIISYVYKRSGGRKHNESFRSKKEDDAK
jgi:hypothetical protein